MENSMCNKQMDVPVECAERRFGEFDMQPTAPENFCSLQSFGKTYVYKIVKWQPPLQLLLPLRQHWLQKCSLQAPPSKVRMLNLLIHQVVQPEQVEKKIRSAHNILNLELTTMSRLPS